MLWKDFEVGMVVRVEADDYAALGGDTQKLSRFECPFSIVGIIVEVTQRTMWVCGVWRWHTPSPNDKFTDDDPEFAADTFQIPRRGPSNIDELVTGRRWIAPLPE